MRNLSPTDLGLADPEAPQAIISLDHVEFRTVLEDAPVMLWLTDATGNMVFTNARWKNFVGKDQYATYGDDVWIEALHSEDKVRVFAEFENAFKARQPFQMEYRLKRGDGEWRYVMDTGEPYDSPDGRFAGFIGSSTDISEHKRFELELKRSHKELTRHNEEMGWINRLNSYLQACRTLHETYPVIRHFAELIFPQCPGTLYLFNESKSLLENVVAWGDQTNKDAPVLSADDCWALRQGKMHSVDTNTQALGCPHVEKGVHIQYICVPVVAQGEMVGMMHLHGIFPAQDASTEVNAAAISAWQQLVSVTADNLALAIVSLKLREALESQSIRDPLTNLYNRRHMEESLNREFARSQRTGSPLGLLMVDLDHFKALNDEHGHEAGDCVLREVARVMVDELRASDIACRFGGEEFVLILPDAPSDELAKKAEVIRCKIAEHTFVYHNKPLEGITTSIGVASLGGGVTCPEELLRAADGALYESKRAGRNQVVSAMAA